MKRFGVFCATLAIALVVWLVSPQGANAQGLTMQMSNGWNFTFTGNVNAFYVFEHQTANDGVVPADPYGVGLVGSGEANGSTIRTGLLPAFATFEAAGTEGETDLKVHFGFAPQIQTPGGHDNFGIGTQAGAQIDMREVYMTVGGKWGQVLAGRALGLYGRHNILTDQTLYGTGATGGNFGDPGGTTLGRIGYGYVYPNFVAQMTYTTPTDRPAQLAIGLFNPSVNNSWDEVPLPRVESEFTYSMSGFTGWANGLVQYQQNHALRLASADNDHSTAWGLGGGLQYGTQTFSLTGSGYYGRGIGTTLMFNAGQSVCTASGAGCAGGATLPATGRSDQLRKSYGFIGQAGVTPQGSKVTLVGSYGQSSLKNATDEPDYTINNRSITGGLYYQATKSLKVVGEGTYAWTDDNADGTTFPASDKNKTFNMSAGMMLFF